MIILLDGKEYAVGLNWFAITSTDEVQQFQKEMELTHGVLKVSKDPMQPSTVALAGNEYDGQVSLAGILSYAYKNLLYVAKTGAKTETGDTLYYLCSVKNGAVSVEGDVIADLETIQALYAANLAEMSAEVDPDEIQRLGTDVVEEEFAGVSLASFATVLEPAQRFASQCIVKTLAKEGLSKLAVSMIVILFVLGSYLMYGWLFKKPPPPPVAQVQPEEVAPTPPPSQQRDPYEVFLEQFAYGLQNKPRPTIVSEVVSAIKQVPLINGGWILTAVNFSGSNKENLSLSFNRASYSNVNEMVNLADSGFYTSVVFDEDGNYASARFPTVLQDVQTINMDAIKELEPGSDTQYYNFVSKLQSYGLAFQINTDSGNPYFSEKSFSMTGTGLWTLQRIAGILSQFETLGINTINMNIQNSEYNWTIEGIIYG